MRIKGDQSLSRKELQCMCKKYGLPANKSSSEMATSLASYFEKNLSSLSPRERLSGTREASLPTFMISGLQPEAPINSLVDATKVNCCSREEGSRRNQTVKINELGYCACPGDNVLPSSMRMFETVSSSSFEFYVHSEDGINLSVDLNSNPSDWIKKMKSEVNICENMRDNKSCSFHQELGRFGESNKQIKSSFPWAIDADQIKDGQAQSGSSPSTFMKENNHVELNHQDGGDGSLTSSPIEPSGIAVVVSENLLEDQGVNSHEPHSDARDEFRSCTDENGCTTTLNSDVNTPRKKLAGNSVVNVSDCSISLGTQEHQKSKPSNVTCEYSAPENSCSLVNSQVVIAGGPAGDSMEMPPSKAAVQQKDVFCKNGEFLDLVGPKGNDVTEQGGLADSREPHLDICRKHLPSSVEESERSELIDGEEGSECLQFEDSFEKTCSRLDDVESNEELSKKRRNIEIEDRNGCGKPDARILRSTKHFAGKVLPRRSMRLVSK